MIGRKNKSGNGDEWTKSDNNINNKQVTPWTKPKLLYRFLESIKKITIRKPSDINPPSI